MWRSSFCAPAVAAAPPPPDVRPGNSDQPYCSDRGVGAAGPGVSACVGDAMIFRARSRPWIGSSGPISDLDAALAGLPKSRRQHLVAEIRQHVDDARAE